MVPNDSLLYISINVDHEHPLRRVVETQVDPLPDLDLGRIVRLLGPSVRRYFLPVIDGTRDELPADLSGVNGIIVGCSGHSVNLDKGNLKPWQQRLVAFIRRAILEDDIPYLGLCGGGQIGLVALGGTVKSNPANVGTFSNAAGSIVIGPTQLSLTEKGKADVIFRGCSDDLVMAALHSDYMAVLPEDGSCDVLANGSKLCHQVVGYKDKVRLFGVHPEISQEYLDETAELVLNEGAFAVAERKDVSRAFATIHPNAANNRKVIENFVVEICGKHYADKLRARPASAPRA